MNRPSSPFAMLALAALLVPSLALAAQVQTIALPKPQTDGGRPLMQALKARHSTREYSDQKLSQQTLSNLLWAAWGINRPDSGKRTAPSARNWQEIDVYVILPEATYVYDAKAHALKPVVAKDLRPIAGTQDYPKTAPVNLLYVADLSKITKGNAESKAFYSAADAGFIAQNVYLFCASEGLGTVVRGLIDRPALAKALGLKPQHKVLLGQTVGYPKK